MDTFDNLSLLILNKGLIIMSLAISHHPYKDFQMSFLLNLVSYNIKIDLNHSVKKKLGETKELTNEVALKILKQVKLESDILSFLTKPIVFIPLSFATLAIGMIIPPTGIALIALGFLVCLVAGSMLGLGIQEFYNSFLTQLSEAYGEQSKEAARCISSLQNFGRDDRVLL